MMWAQFWASMMSCWRWATVLLLMLGKHARPAMTLCVAHR